MTREEREDSRHKEQIVKVLESYMQNYLEILKSDLEQYEDKAIDCLLKNSLHPHRKIIDNYFDEVAKNFELYKIHMVKEEIEILENLDSSIFQNLAYAFTEYTFSFFKEEPTYILSWFIDDNMLEPIFNAILYLEKIKRRKINWVNYRRRLRDFRGLLKKGLEVTEGFFHLIPLQSEDDILRILLARMSKMYLNLEQDGVRAIVFSLFPDDRKRLPKELRAAIKNILIDAGYYSKSQGGIIIRE